MDNEDWSDWADAQAGLSSLAEQVILLVLSCCGLFIWETVSEADYMSRLVTKPTKWHVRPVKTQIRLGGCIRPVWSESLLSAWRKFGSSATHWAHSEDSDQTGRMSRLIWVFAGRTLILLVLSWGAHMTEWLHALYPEHSRSQLLDGKATF